MRLLKRNNVAVLLAAAALLAISFFWHPRVPRAAGPLKHQAYVWQRNYTPAVSDAVRGCSRGSFDELIPLAAEVSWSDGKAKIARIHFDIAALKESGRPIGLAIRLGAYSGPFSDDAPATTLLRSLVQSLLSEARASSLPLTEIQIDFDCAESKLAGYRNWIDLLRPLCASDHCRLTITALPSWLNRRDFATLAAAVDDFVLQVHSFRPPTVLDDSATLCDAETAQADVERAAQIGRPFRVALPTYSYVACFDDKGKVLGISAEAPLPKWPAGSRVRLIRSDESQIAALIRSWNADRPANLESVLWYRLPVSTDALNWQSQTLKAVMAGETPSPKLNVRVARAPDGAQEIQLANDGDADGSLDALSILATAGHDTSLLGADGLNDFDCITEHRGSARFVPSSRLLLKPLAPGQAVTVGWVRPPQEKEVLAHVETEPAASK